MSRTKVFITNAVPIFLNLYDDSFGDVINHNNYGIEKCKNAFRVSLFSFINIHYA